MRSWINFPFKNQIVIVCTETIAKYSLWLVQSSHRKSSVCTLIEVIASADNRIQSRQSIASNRAYKKCRLCMRRSGLHSCSMHISCIMIRNNRSKHSLHEFWPRKVKVGDRCRWGGQVERWEARFCQKNCWKIFTSIWMQVGKHYEL